MKTDPHSTKHSRSDYMPPERHMRATFDNQRGAQSGAHMCPHQVFVDSIQTAARSTAKFGIAIHSSFAHLVLKF